MRITVPRNLAEQSMAENKSKYWCTSLHTDKSRSTLNIPSLLVYDMLLVMQPLMLKIWPVKTCAWRKSNYERKKKRYAILSVCAKMILTCTLACYLATWYRIEGATGNPRKAGRIAEQGRSITKSGNKTGTGSNCRRLNVGRIILLAVGLFLVWLLVFILLFCISAYLSSFNFFYFTLLTFSFPTLPLINLSLIFLFF